MRVPLSWLRDYVDFDLTPERLAERLTLLGMEVQSIDRIGGGWTSVVVGELVDVQPHPNSDRLSLTTVRVSEGDEPLSIVCGATNIAAGQRVPVALPGAVLPGGRQIGVSKIQGAESRGMLCSGAELGLTADADGILILANGPGTAGSTDAGLRAGLGTPLEDVVADVVLDVDVKPNRGDALSMIGLAREVAAISGTQVRWPPIEVPESGDGTAEHLWVEVADRRLCPRFVGRYVDDLQIGPSPVGVQLRLSAAGMRPVSNAVDASNYVMLEMGKPIHVFDAAAVSGGTIVVRTAREGESLETLDHVRRSLTPDTLVIADAGGPIGIAGVMGGANSEVTAATTAAVVESAVFDPVSIRRTAFRYGLRSEASLRFEKGQESRLARLGADRTAQLLAHWAGGRVATGVIDTNPTDEELKRVRFRPTRVNRLLGQDIAPAEMVDALHRVEIATEPGETGEDLVAVVPPHRRDIDIEEDVIEEICRIRGYDTVPRRLPDTEMPRYRLDPRVFEDRLRDLLAGRGLVEVVTNGLIGPQDHAHLGLAFDDVATIRVANPVTVDHSELRRSLLPGMLAVLARNERQRWPSVAIFEIGPVHSWVDGEPAESDRLGLLLAGDWGQASWAQAPQPVAIEHVKGVIDAIAATLRLGSIQYQPAKPAGGVEHPGRTAEVELSPSTGERLGLGRVGDVHPAMLAAYDIRADHVVFAQLDMATLARAWDPAPLVRDIDRLPAVERDLAVIVARSIAAGDVARVIRDNAGAHLVRLDLFDRYEGPPLRENEISLAYRLRFQPTEAALSEAEVEDAVESVAQALGREVGGRIRSGS